MKMEDSSSRDWSSLPQDIVSKIGELLSLPHHRIWFRMVCKSWCSAISSVRIPSSWLLLPGNGPEFGEHQHDSLTFFSVPANKTFSFPCAGISGMHCVGSQDDWLFMAGLTFNLCILNPFSGARIDLPPFYNHPGFEPVYTTSEDGSIAVTAYNNIMLLSEHGRVKREFDRRRCVITKLIFSPNPMPTSFTVVALYLGSGLAFVRAGETKWSIYEPNELSSVVDVGFYEGQFLALTDNGSLFALDLSQSLPREYPIISLGRRTHCAVRDQLSKDIDNLTKYLALSKTNGIFMILRDGVDKKHHDGEYKFHTKKLTILKLRGPEFHRYWDVTNDLEGETFFVGNNNSFSFSPKDSSELRGNRVFLTGILSTGIYVYDMGVYDVANQSFELMYSSNIESNWQEPLGIWFKPKMT